MDWTEGDARRVLEMVDEAARQRLEPSAPPRVRRASPSAGRWQCEACGSHGTKVLETRAGALQIRRRHLCSACGGKFTTYETIAQDAATEVSDDDVRAFVDSMKAKLMQELPQLRGAPPPRAKRRVARHPKDRYKPGHPPVMMLGPSSAFDLGRYLQQGVAKAS